MPSKSGKQHRLMALVANDPKAAKRLGVPQKVGKEFMKADKGKKFASGGMSRPAALEKRRQKEYLERNPQYREREKGLEGVYPEEFITPGGVSKAGSGVMAAVKAGMYRDPKAKRAADEAMRKRVKEAESKKDKLRATSPASAPYRSPNRSPYEPRPQSDESFFRKGGSGVMAVAKDGMSDLEKAVLIGAAGKGAAVMAFDKEQRRKEAERERAEKAKKETEEKSQSSYRKGGFVKSSASSRADGIAQRGKTRGKFI